MFSLIALALAALVPEACESILRVNNQYCQNLESTELIGECIQNQMEQYELLKCKKQFELIAKKATFFGQKIEIKDKKVLSEVEERVLSTPAQGATQIENKFKALEFQCPQPGASSNSLQKRDQFGDKIKDVLYNLQQAYMVIALAITGIVSLSLAVVVALPFIVLGFETFSLVFACVFVWVAVYAAKWTGLEWLIRHPPSAASISQ